MERLGSHLRDMRDDGRIAAAWKAGAASAQGELRFWMDRARQLELLLECALMGLRRQELGDRLECEAEISQQRYQSPRPPLGKLLLEAQPSLRRAQQRALKAFDRRKPGGN
jgi:hypothetical protein